MIHDLITVLVHLGTFAFILYFIKEILKWVGLCTTAI